MPSIFQSFFISLIIQCGFFAIAATKKTDKVTDLSYGLSFVAIALYFYSSSSSHSISQTLVLILILLWGLRLAWFLFQRVLVVGKDTRFDGIRENPFRFGLFWLLQAVSIWIIMLPGTLFLSTSVPLSISIATVIGTALVLCGLAIETIADLQKSTFKANPNNKGMWVNQGLWKYARHPNYFGEMLVWWGVFIIVIPTLDGPTWLTICSPLYISFLLLFVTGIPTVSKIHEQKYGANPKYQEYKRNTRLLIPLPKQKTV